MSSNENEMHNPIVIGLTGPFGSGCTTFANYFDDLSEYDKNQKNWSQFIRYLGLKYYFKNDKNEKGELDLSEFDDKIYRLYTKFKEEKRAVNIYEKLKFNLEKRERLNALSGETSKLALYVNKENQGEHRIISISVSDVIIYMTLGHKISNNNAPDKNSAAQRKKIDNYQKITKKYKSKYNGPLTLIKKHEMIRLQNKKQVKNNGKTTNQKIENSIIQTFQTIREIKKELNGGKKYRDLLQDFGDNIRRCGNPFDYENKFAFENHISNNRWEDFLMCEVSKIIKMLQHVAQDSIFIIDSIKNPYEVEYLREKFMNFYLVSVYADKAQRKKREVDKSLNGKKVEELENEFEANDKRDRGKSIECDEESFYKQNVKKCVELSDIAINNEASKGKFYEKILRYFALILDKGCTKPNTDEALMNQAYALAIR
ncbi:hypothetical protein KAR34_06535 [bacterium]|nr:hypothetical protein [bacterium]